ncbi:MAG: hypothetical protein A2Y40_03990 [Candidatus Margulisbacteria bacterium GWF2_35_9]|nr:MAG: hypothetical protein A2Y40_03990 [Candidatus Margulisbacteria bacterium GWF2_35_9]
MGFEIDIQDFIDEAEEQIRILNDGLLALEKDKKNEEIINEVFRAAHTLKGGSGLVGFDKMTELTHSLESIFDLIRDKKFNLESSHLDVMFEVLDVLMDLMGEVDSGVFNTNISIVSGKLKDILANSEEGAKKLKKPKKVVEEIAPEVEIEIPPVGIELELTATVVEEKSKDLPPIEVDRVSEFMGVQISVEERMAIEKINDDPDLTLYGVDVKIGDECDVISLFMFMIFNKVKELGELIMSNPKEEDLEEDEISEVKILFSSIVTEDVIKNELVMPEVKSISIVSLSSKNTQYEDEEKPVAKSTPIPVIKQKVEEPDDILELSYSENTEESELEIESASDRPSTNSTRDTDPKRKLSTTIRVDSQKIDGLLNTAGELVINKARFVQLESDLERVFGRNAKVAELKETISQLMRITNEMQEGIMQLRMVPIDQVFNKFPRVVRDLSRKLDKKINLVIQGKDTELDKSVVEEISDPLMHLVRNSVDHGIETVSERRAAGKHEEGTILLNAYHQGSSIIIEIKDEGNGIDIDALKAKAISKGLILEDDAKNMTDKEAVNLIFLPGFSTAKQVSDLSGRGVGMDVVKKNVERLNGVIEILTEKGKGTSLAIKLPLTLAIISTLLTRVTKSVYAIPLVNVISIEEVTKKQIYKIANQEAIRIRNEVINILRLDEIFQLGNENRKKDRVQVVIVGMAEHRIGFVVDGLIGEQEVVIKSLDNSLVDSPGIAGASILGDGTVALIVDVSTLIERVLQEL